MFTVDRDHHVTMDQNTSRATLPGCLIYPVFMRDSSERGTRLELATTCLEGSLGACRTVPQSTELPQKHWTFRAWQVAGVMLNRAVFGDVRDHNVTAV